MITGRIPNPLGRTTIDVENPVQIFKKNQLHQWKRVSKAEKLLINKVDLDKRISLGTVLVLEKYKLYKANSYFMEISDRTTVKICTNSISEDIFLDSDYIKYKSVLESETLYLCEHINLIWPRKLPSIRIRCDKMSVIFDCTSYLPNNITVFTDQKNFKLRNKGWSSDFDHDNIFDITQEIITRVNELGMPVESILQLTEETQILHENYFSNFTDK